MQYRLVFLRGARRFEGRILMLMMPIQQMLLMLIYQAIKSTKLDICYLVKIYKYLQRVLSLLRQQGYDKEIFIHGSLEKLCNYYQKKIY